MTWEFTDGDGAYVEVDHDRFDVDAPCVVTVSIRELGDTVHEERMVLLDPKEAREMATALQTSAHDADTSNARLAASLRTEQK